MLRNKFWQYDKKLVIFSGGSWEPPEAELFVKNDFPAESFGGSIIFREHDFPAADLSVVDALFLRLSQLF